MKPENILPYLLVLVLFISVKMVLLLPFSIGAVLLIITTIARFAYNWSYPKCNGLLPPGSLGWPLLGETLAFFVPSSTFDIHPFMKERMNRYGPIFKTSLVGRKIIVSTDSELNYFIFQQENQSFQISYPYSVTEILGRQNLATKHGFMHKYIKNMVLNLLGPESLKRMLPDVEQAANRELKRWSSQNPVELKDAIAGLVFDLVSKKLLSYDSVESPENLRENFEAFISGLISIPVNIPGTAYNKCLKGRSNVIKILKKMLQERRRNPRKQQTDFFDHILHEVETKDSVLTEDTALDLVFLLLFASFETTSSSLTLALKLLMDNPQAMKEVTEEHEAIIRRRQNPDSGLTWSEYKSMSFTFMVIFETLRLANIVPVIFRRALKDINFKGYCIPAGWSVMVCPPAVHLNPSTYEDPFKFNPWRWKGANMTGTSRNFIAFGGGVRFCAGADYAKLQLAVFIHCLVTRYKIQAIKGGDILRSPGLSFPNGFHVHIYL